MANRSTYIISLRRLKDIYRSYTCSGVRHTYPQPEYVTERMWVRSSFDIKHSQRRIEYAKKNHIIRVERTI